MKKFFASFLVIAAVAGLVNLTPVFVPASQAAVKKAVKKAPAPKIKTTMKWDAGALKILNNFASFDYSSTIRNAYIKKVEAYAKRNKIKIITAAVVNGMRE